MTTEEQRIRLAHGGGGELVRVLVRHVFAATFADGGVNAVLEDAALLDISPEARLAFTTDTFVVDPLFFPGGNIGDLAINGTVNDLAMMGAKPLGLSVAMVIEEGFELTRLKEIVATMDAAVKAVGVKVVTGDTKVVARGQADGLFINTSGVGEVPVDRRLSAAGLRPGDRIIVSGPIGDHGIAVMSRRSGLSFEADIVSDTAPLVDVVATMLDHEKPGAIHALRDPTRGGLAAALCEFSEDSKVTIDLTEETIPVRPVVRAACETLGLDPLHVPCEGRFVAAVAADVADTVLERLRDHPAGREAALIGEVREAHEIRRAEVILHTVIGGARLVDLPAGELLPRIC